MVSRTAPRDSAAAWAGSSCAGLLQASRMSSPNRVELQQVELNQRQSLLPNEGVFRASRREVLVQIQALGPAAWMHRLVKRSSLCCQR